MHRLQMTMKHLTLKSVPQKHSLDIYFPTNVFLLNSLQNALNRIKFSLSTCTKGVVNVFSNLSIKHNTTLNSVGSTQLLFKLGFAFSIQCLPIDCTSDKIPREKSLKKFKNTTYHGDYHRISIALPSALQK